MNPYWNKTCTDCGKRYRPTTGNQELCSECRAARVVQPDGSVHYYERGKLVKIVEKDGYVCELGVDFD